MTEEQRKTLKEIQSERFKRRSDASFASSFYYQPRTKTQMKSVDVYGKSMTFTLGYIYPSVASASLRSALQGINALTTNVFVGGTKIVETDLADA